MSNDSMSQAAADVLAERQRQVSAEGWTPEHDDEHSKGDMAMAASCYAAQAYYVPDEAKKRTCPGHWPWAFEWWKPCDTRRDLVKAGALIVAEIERLDRAAAKRAAWRACAQCSMPEHCYAHGCDEAAARL